VTHIERLGGSVEPLSGPIPRITYQWDVETEILSGVALDVRGQRGLTGSIELEDPKGAVVTLDFSGGIMRGIEVVVWPSTQTTPTLGPPTPDQVARYVIPSRPSQPGVAVVEVDIALSVEHTPDESVIHLRVGPPRRAKTFQLAENLLMEVDDDGEVAGFWLLGVPPFPTGKGD
jgi:hypothetical protein